MSPFRPYLAIALAYLCFELAPSQAQTANASCGSGLKITLDAAYGGAYLESGASSLKFHYQLSKTESVSSALVEIWDGPNRLFQSSVPIQTEGDLVWPHLDQVAETLSNLRLAILEPGRPKHCINNCGHVSDGEIVSIILAGTAGGEDEPFPSLERGSSRLLEGSDSTNVVLKGYLLSTQTRILLLERVDNWKWIAREYLPADLLDLQHLQIQIPSAYLSRPTLLGLSAYREGSEEPLGSDTGTPETTVYVMSKDSPVLSALDPAEISPDEAAKSAVPLRLYGRGFTPKSKVLLSLEMGSELDLYGIVPVFISANELEASLPAQRIIVEQK